ncbi:ABC transporter substrate-binding protein, partial [Alicyclobacillus acidiphilus]
MKKQAILRTSGVLCAAAGMLALSGCGTTASNNATSNHTSANSSAISSVSASKRGSGSTLDIVNSPVTDDFNPFSSSAPTGTFGFLYQPLLVLDSLSGKTYPMLGTSAVWSNGNQTMTVELRKGTKWSDGKAFTSADVVFTFDLLKKYPDADLNGVWSKLSSVTAKGNDAVVFQFKQPDVPFAYYVEQTPIVPKHIWNSLGDPTKVKVTNPISTGPFTLASFSQQNYTFKANPNYWGGEVQVPEIRIDEVEGNDNAELQLASGTIDWAGYFIPNVDKVYASRSPNNKYWFPSTAPIVLYPNLSNPLLSQLPVREAISLAIDRQELSTKAEDGYVTSASPTGLVLPSQNSWLDPNLPKQDVSFSYNPKRSIQILESNGY